jgi:DNA-binding transcriptional LysR family regulator
MDIAHLKTFLEIYQMRHFGKAAEKLHITQSAASARIKLLEERLGVRLFNRDKTSVEPTSAAHRFHKYADMVVIGWENARQSVALSEDYSQSLSVGSLADIWHFFLGDWLSDVQKKLNNIAWNFTIHQGMDIPDRLTIGALDLGFVFEPVNQPYLQLQQLGSLTLKLFSTKKNQTLEDALGHGYVKVDWGTSFAYEHSRHFADYPYASMQTNYGIMALKLLEGSGGAAYLPETVEHYPYKNVDLHVVDDAPVFERPLYAIYHKDSPSYEAIKTLVTEIKSVEGAFFN